MGKEAKIGLSIIGVLVIIFAVVLGQKLLSSKDDSHVANRKKPSQSKKENGGKKLNSSKKPRLDLFDPKKRKSPNNSKLDSREKATSALPVSQNLHGNQSLTNNLTDWERRYSKPMISSPLMPKPEGSTQLKAQPGTGSLEANDPGYSTTYSTTNYPAPNVSQTNDSRPGVAVLGPSPSSPYQNQYQYPSNSTTASSNHSDARSNNDPNRTGNYDQYNSRKTQGSVYDQTGRSASSSYPSYKQNSLNDKSSRYHSASYAQPEYNYKTNDYNYEKPTYSRSEYGGGPQSDGTYIVKPHQNYSSISKEVYGVNAYFKALAEVNRNSIPDENRLRVGDRIKTPDLAELEQTYPELCPSSKRLAAMRRRSEVISSGPRYGGSGRQYTVQSGDTLYDIARYELGDAARWTDIYKLNRQLLQDSFDYLTPGLKLEIPSKDGKSSVSETIYDPSPQYGRNPSQYDYKTETPRTATRPSGSYSRPPRPRSYQTTPYGESRATSPGY